MNTTLQLVHDAPAILLGDWTRDEATTPYTIPKGQIVLYRGHLPGGVVKVEYNGKEYVIHPATTLELGRS